MIVDSISNLAKYEAVMPYAAALAERCESRDTQGLPFEVRFKQYDTKSDDKRKFEVHAHTIDLMIGFEGREIIHICPQSDLQPGEPLPNGGDGMKMIGAPQGSAVVLRPGMFVAIFPGEAHMVGGQIQAGKAEALTKWVVKLPCPEAFCV